jgi:DNA polymerase I
MRRLPDCLGREAYYVTDPAEVDQIVKQAWLAPVLYVDTETGPREEYRAEWAASLLERHKRNRSIAYPPGLDPYKSRVRLIQIGFRRLIYLIDWFALGERHAGLKRLLESPRRKKWGVNLKFDYTQLLVNGDIVLDGVLDFGCAARVLGHDEYSLAYIWSAVFPEQPPVSKEERMTDWTAPVLSDAQLAYAALDIGYMMELAPPVTRELRSRDLLRPFRIECEAVQPSAEFQLNGVFLDLDRHRAALDAAALRAAEIREDIYSMLRPSNRQMSLVGVDAPAVNLNSPVALLRALQDYGLQVKATNEEELILHAAADPLVPLLLEYKKLTKLRQAFGPALVLRIHPVTGRIHPSVNQLQTDTFRYSMSKPNLQQVPRGDFRDIFRGGDATKIIEALLGKSIAEFGRPLKIYAADYTAIELVVAAVKANDKRLLDIFLLRRDQVRRERLGEPIPEEQKRAADPHFVNATIMAQKTLMACSDADRQNAKPGGYMFLYHGSADKYQTLALVDFKVKKTQEQAHRERDLWFKAYTGIATWHGKEKRFIRAGRSKIRTMSGYELTLTYDPKTRSYSLPQLLNWHIQNPAAAGNKVALAKLWRYCRPWMNIAKRWTGPTLQITVHDETHLTGPPAYEQEACAALEKLMPEGMNEILGRDDLVLVQARAGDSWKEAK